MSRKRELDIIDSGFAYPRESHMPQSLYDAQMAYFIECIQSGHDACPRWGLEALVVNMLNDVHAPQMSAELEKWWASNMVLQSLLIFAAEALQMFEEVEESRCKF